ncbi:MAG: hypothetical protein L0Y50_09755 [Beijerinckiaceae bacterium]|nr:hypothetical protein [Beijerinckiaceae bacterium]MCI0736538.1 hypothetical protein [Beijerinckiaceae bacterium]
MTGAQPFKGGKKGEDGGVDGFLYIRPGGKWTEKLIIPDKGSRSLNPSMDRDLIVMVYQEGAKMGVFLTLEPPTKRMVTQAAAAGFYKTDYGQFPKIQVIAVEEPLVQATGCTCLGKTHLCLRRQSARRRKCNRN